MHTYLHALLLVLVWLLAVVAQTKLRAAEPEVAVRRDEQGVPLPPDVLRRLGSALFRCDAMHNIRAPFLSPDGDTVYVITHSELLAFDAETGKQRFAYGFRGENVEVTNQPEGIFIEVLQGAGTGGFTLLEHGSGRELRRDRAPLPKRRPDDATVRALRVLSRSLVRRPLLPNPRVGPQYGHTVLLWDTDKDQQLLELGEDEGFHECLAISNRHKLIAFAPRGQLLKIVSVETGRILHELPLGLEGGDWQGYLPVFSSDDTKIYAWRRRDAERQIVEIDAVTGEMLVVVKGRKFASRPPVISPDRKLLAYIHDDAGLSEVPIWKVLRLDDSSEYRTIDLRPARPQATFSPEGNSLWLLGECGLARYDLTTGQLAEPRCDPLSRVQALAFSADSSRLFGVAGAELITWNVATGNECAPRQPFDDFARRLSGVRCVRVDETGKQTIWAGGDSQVRHVVDGKEQAKFYAANGRFGKEYVVSPNSRWIVHDVYYGDLALADCQTGKKLFELYPVTRPRMDYFLAMSPDDRTLAVARRANGKWSNKEATAIELWDLERQKKFGKVTQLLDDSMGMQFSDDKTLRVWYRGEVTSWDVAAQKLLNTRKTTRSLPAFPTTYDRRHVYDTSPFSGDNALQRVDITNDKVARNWNFGSRNVTAFAVSPNKSLAAIATPESPVVLIDLRAGEN